MFDANTISECRLTCIKPGRMVESKKWLERKQLTWLSEVAEWTWIVTTCLTNVDYREKWKRTVTR